MEALLLVTSGEYFDVRTVRGIADEPWGRRPAPVSTGVPAAIVPPAEAIRAITVIEMRRAVTRVLDERSGARAAARGRGEWRCTHRHGRPDLGVGNDSGRLVEDLVTVPDRLTIGLPS